MTLYRILRGEGSRTEWYYPRQSFTLDDWTTNPDTEQWNTALVAIALHHADLMRERERIMGTNRPIKIVATKGDQVWIVNEEEYAYAGRI